MRESASALPLGCPSVALEAANFPGFPPHLLGLFQPEFPSSLLPPPTPTSHSKVSVPMASKSPAAHERNSARRASGEYYATSERANTVDLESSGDENSAGDDAAAGSRKRKRTKEAVSVSCELCKQRKVSVSRREYLVYPRLTSYQGQMRSCAAVVWYACWSLSLTPNC